MKTAFRTVVCSMISFCIIMSATPAAGRWIENGIPICTAEGFQYEHIVMRTDFGLFVFVWASHNGIDDDIYAQCVDPSGNILWAVDGIPVCSETGSQICPVAVTDGAGGTIIMWEDDRSGDYDIYAQRLDPEGTLLWASTGVLVATAASDMQAIKAIPDGSGGAILTWQDGRYGPMDWDIFAERIDASGVAQWSSGGLLICGNTGHQGSPEIVTDDAGGAIIVWNDDYLSDVYATRVRGDGILMWTVGGVPVAQALYTQQGAMMIPDGEGGAIIAWQDIRTGSDYDIYVQRMDAGGSALWTTDGVALSTVAGTQYIDEIVTDGNGGAIVSWTDFSGTDIRVYAQRVNRNGTPQWTANGSLVVTGTDNQYAWGMVSDGAGGFLVALEDDRNGDEDVYLQRISGEFGGPVWTSEGIPVCDYSGDQDMPRVISDGAGGAILVWRDLRIVTDYNIYAQRIDRNGIWGYPAPIIFDAADVPHDQGGRVMLTWEASRLDNYAEEGIQYYSVWRQLGMLEMQALLGTGKENASPSMVGPDFDGEAFRFVPLEGAMYGFEWIGNLDAHQIQTYSYAAPTLSDSCAADPGMHIFMVSAHYYPTVFWDSEPVVAYSVDNLAPCAPMALAGEQSFAPNGMELSWTPNTEPDLSGYRIYRDIGVSFEPGTGNLIATTCDDHLFDGDWGWDVGFCYKVSAVDVNGNESNFAILCGEQVTGDDPMPVPDKTFLSQNFPNPFNPNTTIVFGLKEQGHVSLMIYDAAGRLVANLVDESKPAGSYSANWNGAGSDSRSVSSGVYFYRLSAGTFIETKKMILLK